MCVPRILRDPKIPDKSHAEIQVRRSILKNVCFQIILKIRDEKSRPTLQQVLKKFREKNKSGENVYHFLHKLYRRNNTLNREMLRDKKYEYLVSKHDPLQKMIDIQSHSFDTLHKIIDKYHVRRMQREHFGGGSECAGSKTNHRALERAIKDFKVMEQHIENFLARDKVPQNASFGEECQHKRFERAKKIASLRRSISMDGFQSNVLERLQPRERKKSSKRIER